MNMYIFAVLQPEKKVETDERDGVMKMAAAVKAAFIRAKDRDEKDEVYHVMNSTRYKCAKLPLVEKLLKIDSPAFQEGGWYGWYASSKYSGGRNPKRFIELVQRVENQTEDFVWNSWYE